MDAIILVGGQGTRLRPLTARRHKSLLPVCGRPAFDHLLAWARRGGVTRVVLALGRHNEDLAAAYPPGRRAGLSFTVVEEREPLQSGGAIRNAAREAGVSSPFLVLNGDVFAEFDLSELVAAHLAANARLSIALCHVKEVREFGVATVDREGLITRFVEKSPDPPSHLVNAGAWVFDESLLAEIPEGAVRVEETLFPGLVERRERVLGFQFGGLWADIGTPERYLALSLALIDRGEPAIDPALPLGTGAAIVRSAAGPGCEIGPRALVEGSVLWEGVLVGEGAEVRDSVLADGVIVGPGARLRGCVAGPGARISAGASVPPGTALEADSVYGGVND